MANYHPLLGHYDNIYLGGARVVTEGEEDKGDYQLELLPPEGRGSPICVQGYQSNCNTHAVLTEGALLDENGHHLYPIQGPPVTLHSHFGSSQALGVVRVPVRVVGDPTGKVVHLVCVVTGVRERKEIWASATEIRLLPEVGVMYAEKGIVYSREFLDLAEKRQEALRASGAFDERASKRAEAMLKRQRALTAIAEAPPRSTMDDDAWLNDLPPNRGGSASSKKKNGKQKKKQKKQKRSGGGKGGKGASKPHQGGSSAATADAAEPEGEEEEEDDEEEENNEEGATGGAAQSAATQEKDEDDDELTDNECPCCFYPFGDLEAIQFECQHRFHRDCIACWERTCQANAVQFHCPICRRPIDISLGV